MKKRKLAIWKIAPPWFGGTYMLILDHEGNEISEYTIKLEIARAIVKAHNAAIRRKK